MATLMKVRGMRVAVLAQVKPSRTPLTVCMIIAVWARSGGVGPSCPPKSIQNDCLVGSTSGISTDALSCSGCNLARPFASTYLDPDKYEKKTKVKKGARKAVILHGWLSKLWSLFGS